MKATAVVKTEVEVDLSDFHTKDLIDELEYRGHAVDADCAEDLETADLLKELSSRAYSANFPKMPLDMIISALRNYSCPIELISQLELWAKEPVPTLKKLEVWINSCKT